VLCCSAKIVVREALLFVWMIAAFVGGAQLDVAPVSEMPERIAPLNIPCLSFSVPVKSRDQ